MYVNGGSGGGPYVGLVTGGGLWGIEFRCKFGITLSGFGGLSKIANKNPFFCLAMVHKLLFERRWFLLTREDLLS